MLRLTALLLLAHYCCSVSTLRETNFAGLSRNWPTSVASGIVYTITMSQPLDHFIMTDKRRWKMRFFERIDYFRPGGPLYIYIGGEGEASERFLRSGLICDLAAETGGALYMTEHRFYGQSVPSRDRDHLRYLSSRQALADIAAVVTKLKGKQQYAGSKVVVVGCSYAGNLAAWFRMLYPALADAAVASSAPVLAKVDFYEYFETVGEDYRKYGSPECYQNIFNLIGGYIQSFSTAQGVENLKARLNICPQTDFSTPEVRAVFFFRLIREFTDNCQYKGKSAINAHCYRIMARSDNTGNSTNDLVDCTYYAFPAPSTHDVAMWLYQTCTEFGYFQTTTSNAQPFHHTIPLTYFYKMCSSYYNISSDEVNAAVDRTNSIYGGLRRNVSRVVFTNGGADPWHRLSLLEDLNSGVHAKVTPDATHGQDLMPNMPGDSHELRVTREFIKSLVKQWIGL